MSLCLSIESVSSSVLVGGARTLEADLQPRVGSMPSIFRTGLPREAGMRAFGLKLCLSP